MIVSAGTESVQKLTHTLQLNRHYKIDNSLRKEWVLRSQPHLKYTNHYLTDLCAHTCVCAVK